MSIEKLAENAVEILYERGESQGMQLVPYVLVAPAYTEIRVLDALLWDTEDEHADLGSHGEETVETILAHAEGNIAELAESLLAMVPPKKRAPIPMVLHCPRCGMQHVDAPEPGNGWDNPPHRTHLCHGCGGRWRPANVPTVGVVALDGEEPPRLVDALRDARDSRAHREAREEEDRG